MDTRASESTTLTDAAVDPIEKTLAAAGLRITSALRAHLPGATLRRGDLSREVEAFSPTPVDPIATLPHLTVAPARGDGDDIEPVRSVRAEFQVQRLLGRGGMGQVHLARQRSLRRDVAIKSTLSESPGVDARLQLLHEASITGGLEHPNIIPVHMLGRDDRGDPLMVMKKVEGVTWHTLLTEPEHPAWQKLLREGWDRLDVHLDVLRQVCRALEFAHQAGVIHRDIKPENVMLGGFGEVYLLDWGVSARLDARGELAGTDDVVGTPGFMAPEQVAISSGPQGPWTDVYLLGATLHTALVGRYRHEGGNVFAILHGSLESEPFAYPDAVPAELAALCNRATHRDRRERPASVAAFREALDECVAHRGSMALCRAAGASLDALRSALTAGDREGVVRASAACRFGYAQSIAAWPRNDEAREGLQTCLDLLFDDELARGHLEAAEALATEMPARTASHGERLAALRSKRVADAARIDSLRSAAFETDATVSRPQRTRAMMMWVGLILAFNAMSVARVALGGPPTHEELVGMALAGVAAGALAAWRYRAAMTRNAINRSFVTFLGTVMLTPLVSRVAGARLGLAPSAVVTFDLIGLTAVCVMATGTIARYVTAGTVVLALGAAAAVARPAWAFAAFSVSTSLSLAVSVVEALRSGVIERVGGGGDDAR